MKESVYESAFERFCIMVTDGKLDDVSALKLIKQKYGHEYAMKIWETYCRGKK